MPITVQCTNCQREFRTPDSYAGQRLQCPRCTSPVEVPDLAIPRDISEHPSRLGLQPHPPPLPAESHPAAAGKSPAIPAPPDSKDTATETAPSPAAEPRETPTADTAEDASESVEVSESVDVDVPHRRVPADQSTLIEQGPIDPQSVSVVIAVSQPSSALDGPLPVATRLESWDSVPAVEPVAHQESMQWYLHTEEGEYGPVSRPVMDRWVAEGRVDATCQLFCEGWSQWRWAEDIYPHLGQPVACEAVVGGKRGTGAGPLGPVRRSNPGHQGDDEYRLTPDVRRTLAEIRPWVLFLSALSFLFGGLAGAALVALAITEMVTAARLHVVLLVAALLGPGLYLVLAYFLLVFAQHIRGFLRTSAAADLERLLAVEKAVWQIAGIAVAVLLALCVIVLGTTLVNP